jgi:hypothetical protein
MAIFNSYVTNYQRVDHDLALKPMVTWDFFRDSPIFRSTVAQRPVRVPKTWPSSWGPTIPPSKLGAELSRNVVGFEHGANLPMAIKI